MNQLFILIFRNRWTFSWCRAEAMNHHTHLNKVCFDLNHFITIYLFSYSFKFLIRYCRKVIFLVTISSNILDERDEFVLFKLIFNSWIILRMPRLSQSSQFKAILRLLNNWLQYDVCTYKEKVMPKHKTGAINRWAELIIHIMNSYAKYMIAMSLCDILNKSFRNRLIIERSNYNDYKGNCDAVE